MNKDKGNQSSAIRVSGLIRGSLLGIFVVLLLGQATWMQAAVTGNISGYVKDPSGAAVPGVNVTAKLAAQQISRTVQTNPEGYYTFVALPPGIYEITFELAGFQKLVHGAVKLTVNENVRDDASLLVGAVETEVSVTGSASLVDTASPTLSGLVDDQRVVDLPINGRNVIALARILPGVLNVKAPQQLSDARSGPEMDVNGGRANMNAFTLNGGYFNNPSRNTGMNYPPPDAIQEVRILTHNFSSEYGRNPGSQVNVLSKNGTNAFHGSAWEFLRNDALDARNFFADQVTAEKQNQFGAAVGGPLKKDSLFAFGTYQGLRDHRQAQSLVALVPSAAERSGNFTGSGSTLTNPVDTLTGQPYTDASGNPCVVANVIAPGCISPVATNLLPYIPESSSGLVSSLAASPRHGDMWMARFDWNQSPKNSFFGHFFYDRNGRSTPFAASGNIPNYMGENFSQNTRQVTLNDTYAFSPTLLNQAVVTMLRTTSFEENQQSVNPSEFGINLPQYVPTGSLSFDVGGNFNLGSGYTTRFTNMNWQFKDSVNWIKGRHNFKFGYEYLFLNFRQNYIGSPGYNFTGLRSGDPFADFLMGAYNLFSIGQVGNADTDVITKAHSAFFHDEFKVTSRFTLSYGIRYEPFLPWVERHNHINTFVFGRQSTVVPDSPPGILFPGDLPRGLANNDYNNFAPRIGFAWDLFGDGKTSFRGGYGVFYESVNGDSLAQQNPPYVGSSFVYSGRAENPYGSLGLVPPPTVPSGKFGCVPISSYPGTECPSFPLPVGGSEFTDLTLRTPYIQSFDLAIQRQITPTVLVEAAYAGKIGIKIEALRPFNAARFVPSAKDGSPPSDQNVNDRVSFEPGIISPTTWTLGNDFRSWYHSFQVQVTKRYSKGFSILGSYTLSKSIDSSSTDNLGATVYNPFDLRQERGRSDWDRRHAFVASWLWSPPIKFSSKVANTMLGGWTFGGITSIQSGFPLTFIMGQDVALDGTGGYQLALLASGATRSTIQVDHPDRGSMVSRFFNPAAFIPTDQVPRGIYGNAGRGLISGPAFNTSDFSILKDFTFKENYRFQFRTEFFNAFNQVNFNSVQTQVTAGNFGSLTGAAPGRVIQFALKFLW